MRRHASRKLRLGGFYLLLTALCLLIAVLLNLVMQKLPSSLTQISMSSADVLRLDASTRAFLQQLDDDVTLYWIVRGGQEDTYIERLLSRMEDCSGKLTVEKTDPVVHPGVITRYTSGSVNQNSIVAVCAEKSSYIDYTQIYIRDESESSKTIFNGQNAICSAIQDVTTDTANHLYLLTGHAEQSLPERFQQRLEEQGYTISELSLLSGNIPDDCACLVVTGAEKDLTASEAQKLDAYLRSGGSLCLFTRYLDDSTPNWNALLSGYALSAAEGIAVEAQSGWYVSDYPYYLLPKIEAQAANTLLTQSSLRVLLPLTQTICIQNTLPDGVSCQALLTTSPYAYNKLAGFSMQTTAREDGDILGAFTVGVSAQREEEGGAVSSVCWIPTAYALNDTVNDSVSGGNAELLLSCLNWLTQSGSAPVPTGKQIGGGTLDVNSGASDVLSIVVIVAVPLMVVLCGAITLRRRKRR